MTITTRKLGKKRFFYENGQRLAFYDLEKEGKDDVHANIYGDALKLDEGVNSLGLWKSNFKNYSYSTIKDFMHKSMKLELANLMLEYLEHDFGLFFKTKETVVFS